MSDVSNGQAAPGRPAAVPPPSTDALGAARPAPDVAGPSPSGGGRADGVLAPPLPSRPKIGDTRPAPPPRPASPPEGPAATATRNGDGRPTSGAGSASSADGDGPSRSRRRRRGGRGRGGASRNGQGRPSNGPDDEPTAPGPTEEGSDRAVHGGSFGAALARRDVERADEAAALSRPGGASGAPAAGSRRRARPGRADVDEEQGGDGAPTAAGRRRRGRERNGRPVGRYLMCVHVRPEVTQIAVLEGRSLIEHHVARAQDDANQIDGNIYRGRVKNVLPGMEAAFVDIGTPKNAVLYWGDVQADRDDAIERDPSARRIEHLLRPGQTIVCQVTKNPIGLKGARLTEEISLPGRFVVLVPGASVSGISKRLDDHERKRLRKLLDEVRPEGHGLIVRTAAEGVSADELRKDVEQLLAKWADIEEKARRLPAPSLLHSDAHLALRVIREEFTEQYRGVIVDDLGLFEAVRDYVRDIDPSLVDRVQHYDPAAESLPIFERHHVHEQLHKALDRKVWLPSGGSLIIERTEALTVIDVNTGKNVGSSNLEETVFRNNLEAADEIARQLRLRDIGGIIVIDFIDMEIKANRHEVTTALRSALARDKTPTQVFDISELGLVEMTRKRVGEGLVEALSDVCPACSGRGLVLRDALD